MTASSDEHGSQALVVTHVSAVPPEARSYQGRRAGIVSRLIANTIDFGVTLVVLAAGYLGATAVRFLWSPARFRFPQPSTGLLLAGGALIMLVYLTLSWTTTGRTYGDHVLGLRVVSGRYQRLGLAEAALRASFCVVLPIGLLYAAISRTNRSLQDIVLRTSVIYDWGPASAPGR